MATPPGLARPADENRGTTEEAAGLEMMEMEAGMGMGMGAARTAAVRDGGVSLVRGSARPAHGVWRAARTQQRAHGRGLWAWPRHGR